MESSTDLVLTMNGIISICKREEAYVYTGEETRLFQIIEIKDFANDETKKKLRIRLKISDGYSSVIALIYKEVYNEMIDTELKLFDIISIGHFEKQKVKDKNIIILKVIKVVKSGLKEELGKPVDVEVNLKLPTFEKIKEIKLPSAPSV
jgi:hypothetical protein